MDKNNKSAFTLTELLVVVVLVGILAVLAMPSFRNAQRRAIDKEAKINLKVMETAFKMKKLEKGGPTECSGPGNSNKNCNKAFDLDLPAAPPLGNWLYKTIWNAPNYTFQGTGSKGTPTTGWQMNVGDPEPTPF